ncbi:MAG: D-inositol-3-phosphate glycosyltransferase, partial [Ilumatobacteraceae bacterium]
MRAAVISMHTSPLAQPGSGDSGGMNVYVLETVSALAHLGVDCVTYTRADAAGLPREVLVEPGHLVVHIEAGPHHLPK